MSKKCPCKDCKDRCSTCHDTCTLYKEWKTEKIADRDYLNSFRLPPKQWKKRCPSAKRLDEMHLTQKPKD